MYVCMHVCMYCTILTSFLVAKSEKEMAEKHDLDKGNVDPQEEAVVIVAKKEESQSLWYDL